MLPFPNKVLQEKELSSEEVMQQNMKKKFGSFSLEQSEGTDVTHTCVLTESIQTQPYVLNEHLFLMNFKTMECGNNQQHSYKTCLYYHSTKDKRRYGNFYSSELCEYAEKDQAELCPLCDECPKSHNRLEQLYKPDKYKKKFCSYYPNNLYNCEYGKYCSFAHSESEILIDLIHNYEYDEDFYLFHYKTVWCPFNLTQHDKLLCVYAHNWQDYRRKPHIRNYEPFLCLNWKNKEIIINYEDGGCPNNENCNRCHGWKENEYHPLNYKTKPCSNGFNCNKGSFCPYFHTVKDRRMVSLNIQSKFFKFYPRNRIISNTFKVRASSVPFKNQNSLSPTKQTNQINSTIKKNSLQLPVQDFRKKSSILIPVQEESEKIKVEQNFNIGKQYHPKYSQQQIEYIPYQAKPEKTASRKTVEEKPHKRLSFLDEEALRRRSDSKMFEENSFSLINSKPKIFIKSPPSLSLAKNVSDTELMETNFDFLKIRDADTETKEIH